MTPHTLSHRRESAGPIIAAAVLLLTVAAVLLIAPDALAASSGNDVGRRLGDFLKGIAGPIYGGVIAIVSIVFLLNRRYSELGMFVLAAIVVGWFVFSGDSVGHTARSIANQIFG